MLILETHYDLGSNSSINCSYRESAWWNAWHRCRTSNSKYRNTSGTIIKLVLCSTSSRTHSVLFLCQYRHHGFASMDFWTSMGSLTTVWWLPLFIITIFKVQLNYCLWNLLNKYWICLKYSHTRLKYLTSKSMTWLPICNVSIMRHMESW